MGASLDKRERERERESEREREREREREIFKGAYFSIINDLRLTNKEDFKKSI